MDENGSYWQVWDVRPERVERRSIERRKSPWTDWDGFERRKGERRRSERRNLQGRRLLLSDGAATGWLLFESLNESRRLDPIPSAWEKYTQTQLRMLVKKAALIGKPGNGDAGVA